MNVHDQILTIHVVIDFSGNHIKKYEWVSKTKRIHHKNTFWVLQLAFMTIY
jgi:hypothetical protein